MYKRGYHGDLNETFFVGTPKETAKKLVTNTWECLQKAVESVKPGVKFRDVGNLIQKHAQSEGFSVVRSYCGHGKQKYNTNNQEKLRRKILKSHKKTRIHEALQACLFRT